MLNTYIIDIVQYLRQLYQITSRGSEQKSTLPTFPLVFRDHFIPFLQSKLKQMDAIEGWDYANRTILLPALLLINYFKFKRQVER